MLLADEIAVVAGILRGEQPLQNLTLTSVRYFVDGPKSTIDNPNNISVTATAADLADAIVNLRDDPVRLAEWARFVLVGSEVISFEEIETGDWERLLSYVWDLANGTYLNPAMTSFAEAVRGRNMSI